MTGDVRYAIDSLAERDGRFFARGWVQVQGSEVERAAVRVAGGDGDDRWIECSLTGVRRDVPTTPEMADDQARGIVIGGRMPPGATNGVSLVARCADGRVVEAELPGFPTAYVGRDPAWRPRRALARVRDRLGRDGVKGTTSKVASRVRNRLVHRLVRGDRHITTPAQGRTVLVIDHAMGGGANRFRDELVGRLSGQAATVYLATPTLATLSYTLRRVDGSQAETFGSQQDLLDALARLVPREVHLNSLVSFDDPQGFVDGLLAWPFPMAVHFYVHDFFAACPSWTLTDDRAQFCGVPPLTRCAECLPRCEVLFTSLYPTPLTIPAWRSSWDRLLQRCDTVTAFSADSAALLDRAFPGIADRLTIRPHTIDYLPPPRPLRYAYDGTVRIGVLGHLNTWKGARVLAELVRLGDADRLPIEFHLLGSIDSAPQSPRLVQHGPYRPQDLADQLEQLGITACFLPSVGAETFSYVTGEIMHVGMPLAVFDIGAPRERVSTYPMGAVLTTMEPAKALQELYAFGVRMARERDVAARID